MSALGNLATFLGLTQPAAEPPLSPALWEMPAEPTALVRHDAGMVNPVTNMGTPGDKSKASRADLYRVRQTEGQLDAMYRFNPYARKGVDWLPDNSIRKGWLVLDDSDETPGESVMSEADEELSIPTRIADADRWGRLHGRALVMMVTDDELPDAFKELEDGEEAKPEEVAKAMRSATDWLMTPLDPEKVNKVMNLVVLQKSEFQPDTWDVDLRSQTFRQPLSYRVTPRAFGGAPVTSFRIHASRCLRFGGNRLPNRLMNGEDLDDSVLDAAVDAIFGKSAIDNAGAIMAHEAQIPVFKVAGLPAKGTAFGWDAFMMRMQALALGKSISNAVVLGDDESYENHPASLTGWGELDATQKEAVAAALNMPVTEIFGTAPTGMNTDGTGEQSRKAEAVSAHQTQVFLPQLRILYGTIYASKEGPTSGKVPEKWSVDFLPLDEPTGTEMATIAKLEAEADSIRIADAVYTAKHVALSRFQNGEQGLLPVDPEEAELEAAKKAEEMALAMQDQGGFGGDPEDQGAKDQEVAAGKGEQGLNAAQGKPQGPQADPGKTNAKGAIGGGKPPGSGKPPGDSPFKKKPNGAA